MHVSGRHCNACVNVVATDVAVQANINLHPEKLKTLMSGEVEAMEYTNASLDQGGLFAQKISLGKDMTASQVMSKMQGQI